MEIIADNILTVAPILVFFICFFGLITGRKIIKSIILMAVMQASVVMFFLTIGFRSGISPPIGGHFEELQYVADPLPHALMITAIVIGVAVTTINITMLMSMFRKFKTTDWDIAEQKSMEDVE